MNFLGNRKEEIIFSEFLQQFAPEERINKESSDVETIEIIRDNNLLTITASSGLVKKQPIEENLLINNETERILFYEFLKEYYNRELEWGILTGVKPVKLYRKAKKEGYDPDKLLKERFQVSQKKIDLLKEINTLQEPVLDKYNGRDHLSLYIGIPICPQKCSYCSFVSTIIDKKRELLTDYLKALKYEIEETGEFLKDKDVVIDSIYIGGGTPSILNAEEARALIRLVKDNFDLSNVKEFTFEAGRSDTIDENLLKVLKNEGITRLCLNPQSMNKKTLEAINRNIDPAEVIEDYKLMRDLGFENINMDLICGLGDETEEEFLNSLNQVIALEPENITIHDLSIKKGSKLKEQNGFKIKDTFSPEFLDSIIERLEKQQYNPYYMYRQKYTINNGENIGYTKPNTESIYNILMMAEEQSILGLGAGSSGKLYERELDRFSHVFTVKDIRTYNNRYKEIVDKKIKDYKNFFEDNHKSED